MYGQGFRPRTTAPVSVGEELDVKIEAVGEKGDGIAKKKGFVLFVPGTQEGEECRVKVTKVLRKVGFAEKIGAAQGPIEVSEPPKKAPAKQEYEEGGSEPEEEKPKEDSDEFGEDVPKEESGAPELAEEPEMSEDEEESETSE